MYAQCCSIWSDVLEMQSLCEELHCNTPSDTTYFTLMTVCDQNVLEASVACSKVLHQLDLAQHGQAASQPHSKMKQPLTVRG